MGYDILPWQDRFNEPDAKALRQGLPAPLAKVFDQARAALIALDAVSESLQWHGDCYRWCLEYRASGDREPLAILVPAPFDLQLAMPVDQEFLDSLPVRGLKRAIRDGLDLAHEPFDTTWAIWSLTPEGLLDDVMAIVDRKFRRAAV